MALVWEEFIVVSCSSRNGEVEGGRWKEYEGG